jgi:imidazolonepropionase
MITLYFNIAEAITLSNAVAKNGANLTSSDLSIITDAAIVVEDGIIKWAGEFSKIPPEFSNTVRVEINCKNKVVTPALVDSHTHLIFAGNRSHEYNRRLSGASYEEIAKAGGGIKYSSSQTNLASKDVLYNIAFKRIQEMYQLGVGALEIKTGYSLTLDGELELLKIINKLKQDFKDKITIHRTLLSAHAIPANFDAATYIDSVVLPSIDIASKNNLVDSVDVFHEKNYFSSDDVIKIFKHAKKYSLATRLHADELNNNHGAKLASELACLSADHLLNTDEEGAKHLARQGVIANLLPATAFFLGKPQANAKMLVKQGCALAIASDFNPGSSYINDVFSVARMSAPTLGINPAAFWCAITFNAARALNLNNLGAIVADFEAKLICWDTENSNDLIYDWTRRPSSVHL